ncbi:MAG: heavy-metal-associated domain-containing protein [Clostridiales bacterium]|nr:heavy-metal-associated domain-containing protein [Clostridiales bacterium]
MKQTVKVDGMMCNHCASRVEKVLSLLGISEIVVSLSDKTVTFEDNGVAIEDAKTAIIDAGFDIFD